MKDKKIVFMGTPDFAVPILQMLIENYDVVLVVTQPDKPVGRKQIMTPSPIKQLALNHHIDVFQPAKIRTDYDAILKAQPDLIITCAYGQIIPKEVLDIPVIACFNVHASLLPKYRGGAPIHKALIDGEKETGITIMYMDVGMDTGDMVAKKTLTIEESDNVGTLHEKLSQMGADLLKETLPQIINGTNKRIKQNEEDATYAYNIKREEEHLDFTKNGQALLNQIRGLNPWPTANFYLNGLEYKALEAEFVKTNQKSPGWIVDVTKTAIGISCADGIIYITKIKPFGKKVMPTKDFLNGLTKENLLNQKVE
ncbi:MAG: methionyl-tRNA formyltransferase [Bacilli bacterium]|nr:methionyl-tRNA formyltransferase [Bacilli bacterium]